MNTPQTALADQIMPLPAALVHRDTINVLSAIFARYKAQNLLELGTTDGLIAKALRHQGYSVIAETRSFYAGDGATSFDAAYFANSLHHIDASGMSQAIGHAVSVVGPRGIVLVNEPLAEGSFSRVMRPIEDESIARKHAAQMIEQLLSEKRIVLKEVKRWTRESRFHGLDDFVAYLARTSPSRAAAALANRAALARAWREHISSKDGLAVLLQPMICWVLAGPQAGAR